MRKTHRIVFLDRSTVAPQIRLRAPAFAHELVAHDDTAPEQVVPRLAGATLFIIGIMLVLVSEDEPKPPEEKL